MSDVLPDTTVTTDPGLGPEPDVLWSVCPGGWSLMSNSVTSCVLRLPRTPAVRVPRHKERVFSISVNGSPVAVGREDVVLSVPVGNGEVSVPGCRTRETQ